ncbi:MAG: bifunctional phosphoribosyl-AMP cyclohydrolase/phosphoribosyl-ATP diphosphatase HisIE [Syntrophomonadaceae bacterium]|jgi:phosphoribosyl-ATP pyrophosphohydrolase/phosphoribosyl-AMP cyclohydrolase
MTNKIKFDGQGLIPAVIQDHKSGKVLMLAYMNAESLDKTIETGYTWFYSRSRQQLWKKGESSGHVQKVMEIRYDCDGDALLIAVEQIGPACHTGHQSCFFTNIDGHTVEDKEYGLEGIYHSQAGPAILYELFDLIAERQAQRPEGSYTTYLFEQGLDKILKKVGEEAAEVIIAAKNRDQAEVIYEVSDLVYHVLVLLVERGVTLSDIFTELKSRR